MTLSLRARSGVPVELDLHGVAKAVGPYGQPVERPPAPAVHSRVAEPLPARISSVELSLPPVGPTRKTWDPLALVPCPPCSGTGSRDYEQRLGHRVEKILQGCRACSGSGSVLQGDEPGSSFALTLDYRAAA